MKVLVMRLLPINIIHVTTTIAAAVTITAIATSVIIQKVSMFFWRASAPIEQRKAFCSLSKPTYLLPIAKNRMVINGVHCLAPRGQ